MFATRNDQENLVHGQQTAAAAKPLNQGVKGYGSKTPAPKTPFRVPLNDENVVHAGGKSALKTNGKAQLGGAKKGANVDSNVVTPAGPRNRAPLGMKTTNVKTKAFETPAPLTVRNQAEKTLQKTVSPRLRRPKVKIHQPEPVAQIESDDEPDIEHMPPRGEPLPDYPSDTESESHWGPNKTFPQFEGEHFTRGYADVYFNTEETRKEHEEKLQKEVIEQAALMDKQAEQDMEDTEARLRVELGLPAVRKVEKSNEETEKRDTTKPTFSKSAKRDAPSTSSTLTSRSAAAALAAPTKAPLARSAAPTATQPPPAQHKGIVGRKARDVSVGKQSNNSQENVRAEASNAKHAAASAATRSTLGYSKGRAASSTLRKPLGALSSNGNTKAKQNSDATPTSQGATKKERHETDEFDRLAAISSLGTSEVDDDLGINGGVASMGVYAEEDELFQLNFGG